MKASHFSGIMPPAPATRLELPQVTLCAISSVNLAATIRALDLSIAQIAFSEALLFTDIDVAGLFPEATASIRVVRIRRLTSAAAYSAFLLESLWKYISTSHCLVVQWDGHVIDAGRWRSEFLDYDYVGASWPQFGDGHDVGNGGFSLRSRRLLEMCRSSDFESHHPEDLAIGRTNRILLEQRGLRFAPRLLADDFAAERSGDPTRTFGYHGAFLMHEVLGCDGFWKNYETLDDHSTIRHDLVSILKAQLRGPKGVRRCLRILADRCSWGRRARSI